MARKLGIVMGNGRRSTPLTERKLEPEERSWEDTAILRERSLREPVPQRVPAVEGGAQRRKRTRISKERESRERGRKERPEEPCEIRRWKEETVGLLLSIRPPPPFFIFLFLSLLRELRAETVRGIKLTSSTCWRLPRNSYRGDQ